MSAPFHPTRAFQAYQLFAANTNVGKTVFATGLCRAAAIAAREKNRDVFYLKPVQTGYPVDSDQRHVKNYASSVHTDTLYAYPDPVSPHLATEQPPQDDKVMEKTKQKILEYVRQAKQGGSLFLETAGGIHSPVMSGTSQADFYRPLRLPTLLVGDSQLGGISTTMTSYESLLVRGYDIPEILLFDNQKYRNHELMSRRLDKVDVTTVPAPPRPLEDPVHEATSMEKYYAQLDEHLLPVIERLDQKHEARFERLEQMAQKSRDIFWWPFTQHGNVKDVTVIDSAYNDHFVSYAKSTDKGQVQPKEMFDSCASWWTQGLGHANPELTLAAAHAAGRYGHVIFPEATNETALGLAEKVLEKDTWASRVFFSDNGSTAMEVALKMAMRSAAKRYDWSNNVTVDVLGVDGSYHGDTIGVMDACPPNVYNDQVQWYKPRGHWLKPPSVHVSQGRAYVRVPGEVLLKQPGQGHEVAYDSLGEIYSVDKRGVNRDLALAEVYKNYIRTELHHLRSQGRHIGALLMEPVIMGAGGMVFVDPLFQHLLVDVVRKEGASILGYSSKENSGWQGVPVIFDEVFSGWYRLGRRSAAEFLGVTPDIVAYAKTLTGGLLPLALTVTKQSIFNTFFSDSKPGCLLHGHSYTAHPMGCAVAKQSIETLDKLALPDSKWAPFRDQWKDSSVWSMWNRDTIDQLSHLERVESVMSLGSILAVELKDTNKGYGSMISQSIIQRMRHGHFENAGGIQLFARPLGNIVYLMTSQITTPERVRQCEQILLECLQSGV
ncbi:hypothetical protein DFQ28_007128 [Apophysomyces sp. BC1034]|nr:hypothetical protein DFQ30_007827 [Apophysomyces sp. BC1015]KAG0181947.1 hypothetical protein DFQ29_006479 [Apophysomyces sp. BC1021]KAG0192942.1 hypothetical protein DFQ28_007128 [Apophysomyces sp. BC1034]